MGVVNWTKCRFGVDGVEAIVGCWEVFRHRVDTQPRVVLTNMENNEEQFAFKVEKNNIEVMKAAALMRLRKLVEDRIANDQHTLSLLKDP